MIICPLFQITDCWWDCHGPYHFACLFFFQCLLSCIIHCFPLVTVLLYKSWFNLSWWAWSLRIVHYLIMMHLTIHDIESIYVLFVYIYEIYMSYMTNEYSRFLHNIHIHALSFLPWLLEILFLTNCYLQGRRQLPSILNSYSRNFTSWPVTRLWSISRLDGSFHSIQFYGNPHYWPWHAYKSISVCIFTWVF